MEGLFVYCDGGKVMSKGIHFTHLISIFPGCQQKNCSVMIKDAKKECVSSLFFTLAVAPVSCCVCICHPQTTTTHSSSVHITQKNILTSSSSALLKLSPKPFVTWVDVKEIGSVSKTLRLVLTQVLQVIWSRLKEIGECDEGEDVQIPRHKQENS